MANSHLGLVSAALAIIFWSLPASAFAAGGDALASGQKTFEANCAMCHGIRGDGKGEAAARFKTAPRDLTEGVYKFRSTGSGQPPTDDDLVRTISLGIPGTAMVARGDLTDKELRSLVDYIKSLSAKFSQISSPKPLPIASPPIRDKAVLVAGKRLYQESGCVECHGLRGRGDGPSAAKLSVRPADLTQRPLKSGATAKDIYRSILTGLDGTSMPSYHLVLTEQTLWTLAYYIESSGGTPLITDDERLGREIVRQLKTAAASPRQ